MLTSEEAAMLRNAVNHWKDAENGREGDAIALHRAINRQQVGHVATAEELEAAMKARGLDADGVDFERIAAIQNDDSRHVAGWQAPRELARAGARSSATIAAARST